jgi:antitoxin component of MazEF toxin-antitoxin module
MVKIQEYKNQYFVTIPKDYVEQAKWSKGDSLTVSFNERGNIELKKVEKKKGV